MTPADDFLGSPAYAACPEPDDIERRARERRARRSEPCSRPGCVRGTWSDSNGCPRRCIVCNGTGRQPVTHDDPILEV